MSAPSAEPLSLTVDGAPVTVDAGTTGTDLYAGRREVVVVRVDGELRDLHLPLVADELKDSKPSYKDPGDVPKPSRKGRPPDKKGVFGFLKK